MIISFKVRFGTDVFKTDICKKSLNPQWNSEWFKFEVKLVYNCLKIGLCTTCKSNLSNVLSCFFLSFLQVEDESLQDEPLELR